MKLNIFAVCLVLIFAFTSIAQEDSQTSPSDETIVVPSEIAPTEDGTTMMMSGDMIGCTMPMVQQASCIQIMPANCCSRMIMPVVYQESFQQSSPVPTTPATPAPISSQIGSSSVLQAPIPGQQIFPNPVPIQQSSPLIQSNGCNGHMIGNQPMSPIAPITNNQIISPTTTPPITPASTTITPDTNEAPGASNVPAPPTPNASSTWTQPSNSWVPATSFDYSCCPQNRGFFRGRFFGRWR